MKIKRKISLLLVFVLTVSLFSGLSVQTVQASETVILDEHLTWSDNEDGTATITGYTGGPIADPTVAEVVYDASAGNLSVVGIDNNAFTNKSLTGVLTIPNGVTSIGDAVFSGNQLTEVNIPTSVNSIGSSAFKGNVLTSVTIPDSVTSIGYSAFEQNKLQNISISNNISIIAMSAFANNELRRVTIPKGVITLGMFAFSNNSIENVEIPDSVTTINMSAFTNNELSSVLIPDSVKTIEDFAFFGNNITKITIGSDVSLGFESIPHNFKVFYDDVSGVNKQAGNYVYDTDAETWSLADADVTTTFNGTLRDESRFLRPAPNETYEENFDAILSASDVVEGDEEYNYFVIKMTPEVSGTYAIEVTDSDLLESDGTESNDTFLLLYEGDFDKDQPLINLLAANDDIAMEGDNLHSWLPEQALEEGTDYYIVVTSYISGTTGEVTFRVVGPGSVTVEQIDLGSGGEFAGGSGTEEDPYQVATAEQLGNVRNHKDKHFIQTAEIDLQNDINGFDAEGWEPIGTSEQPFTGTYDGSSYEIISMDINRPNDDYQGLFGKVSGATIKNIRLFNFDITGKTNVGGLAGQVEYTSTIADAYAIGNITAEGNAGVLVGWNSGDIVRCYTSGSITSSDTSLNYTGGLVGFNGMMVGGLISDSYSSADVTGTRVGGLVGWNAYGTVENSYATGLVTQTRQEPGDYKGGLVGRNQWTVTNSFYSSETTGADDTGKGTPKTSFEMKQQDTFAAWNFVDVWEITIGATYPTLKGVTRAADLDMAPPFLVSASVEDANPNQVILTFDENIEVVDEASAKADMTVKVDGVDREISIVTGYGSKTLTVALSQRVSNGQTVIFSFANSAFNIYDGIYQRLQKIVDFPVDNNVSEADESGDFVFDPATGTITDYIGSATDITIPDTIDGVSVAEIGTRAFAYNNLTSVTVPDSVTTIESYAFEGNQITTVMIPNSVTYIGLNAFWGNKLNSIVIPDSVEETGNRVFENNQLKSVTIGNSLNELALGMFKDNQLTTVVIPDNVTSIRNEVFSGNPLTSITIGSYVSITNNNSMGMYGAQFKNDYWEYGYAAGTYNYDSNLNKWVLQLTEFAGGSGTEEDPYQVATANHLNNVRNHLDKHFIQIADIDLDGYNESNWLPIGTNITPYTGSYDGKNHSIIDMQIIRHTQDNVGLFGYVASGTIKNVNLDNVDISGKSNVGGLIGRMYINNPSLEGEISNVSVTGVITGRYSVGGLAGYIWHNENGKLEISDCSSNVDIEGTNNGLGGLVGSIGRAIVVNSYATGDVIGDSDNSDQVGGLIGYAQSVTILNTYATGNVAGNGANGFGGVGGLVGVLHEYDETGILNSYATGNVSGSMAQEELHYGGIGGLVGVMNGYDQIAILNSYATGDVTGNKAGGFVGAIMQGGLIFHSYSTGKVSGGNNIGGLVGYDEHMDPETTINIVASFWNTETSGLSFSVGGEGKTADEMIDIKTYTDAGWTIEAVSDDGYEGYPYPGLKQVQYGESPWRIWADIDEEEPGGEELTIPGAPTNVTASAGNEQATLSFVAPENDGGSPIIEYIINQARATSQPKAVVARSSLQD
ncbi:leucine-rich repeat protein [Serpentinicella alkaliphila]|uniref:GLUG motif-containing protein n=1 Tax=Serpentinicella alkaliphila TaxID=1734049 RepID=A0A4R2TEU7_9FIRM|nr:leucine-rich repeat protein [Serpentinicella alkaliphila]QUH25477.1 leucine-rich repeat protein [Serpentinicella alkaliphila]TCQ01601.1 GLUG motif-containing protein [Serpentinicella alkaliphila]